MYNINIRNLKNKKKRARKLRVLFLYAKLKRRVIVINARRKAFCLEFAKTGNATQSAKKAGYSEKTAASQGQRLLKKVDVIEEIKKITQEVESEQIAQVGEMQKVLTSIIRQETQEQQIVVEGIGNGASFAKIMERNPQLKDVIKAVETLARMQGVFESKQSVNICIPVFGGEEDLEE